jgi:thymidine phosphorylase
MSPKEFLFQKQPKTDVERIAALAYYLTHYRDMSQFKTLDLTKLNTEAAQPKFSNAASSANNAVKQNYLVPTTKGQRQLSAAGERFVAALPDREAARAAMNVGAPRRRARKSNAAKSKPAGSGIGPNGAR